jgi:hypothetical protein
MTTLFVKKVLNEVNSNINKNALALSMGFDLDKPPSMISDVDYYSFFEKAAEIDIKVPSVTLKKGCNPTWIAPLFDF